MESVRQSNGVNVGIPKAWNQIFAATVDDHGSAPGCSETTIRDARYLAALDLHGFVAQLGTAHHINDCDIDNHELAWTAPELRYVVKWEGQADGQQDRRNCTCRDRQE